MRLSKRTYLEFKTIHDQAVKFGCNRAIHPHLPSVQHRIYPLLRINI